MGRRINRTLIIILSICIFLSSCGNADPTTCTHKFGKWKTRVEATCNSTGLREQTCKRCGQKETEIIEETHVDEALTEAKEPTCTDMGYTEIRVCTLCRKTTKSKKLIAALGHDFERTPIVDSTLVTPGLEHRLCKTCGHEEEGEAELISPEWIDMPVIYLDGDITGISKTREVYIEAKFSYFETSFESYATLKIQGNSSAAYEKKNFTIKFFEDAARKDKNNIDFGWGEEHKYCLKANYVDYSQARNLVSCNIFADIVATRKNIDSNIKALPTYGTVDGFPVMLYLNGSFHGLYTLNIPKDNWLYGMKTDENKKQALLCADQWYGGSVGFGGLIDDDFTGWDLEHCSTADTEWVQTSFNRLISFVMNNSGDDFRNGIGEYMDVESAIDAMLFTLAMDAVDNTSKNINYVTYDGKKWIVSVYDLDATWGLYWDGSKFAEPGRIIPEVKKNGTLVLSKMNLLYQKIFLYFEDEVKARYKELRGGILTENNIAAEFNAFNDSIPELVREGEKERWPNAPGQNYDHMTQIYNFAREQLDLLDDVIYNY